MAHHSSNLTHNQVTGWVGWAFFASFMLMLSGIFQGLYGLVAIFNDKYFVATANQLLLFDVSQWGWIHLITGIVVFFAGLSILSGSMFGRVVGIIVALLSAIVSLANIGLYPVWSIIVITLDVLVIYALTAHGKELRDDFGDEDETVLRT
jgi:hypothetical protein